MNEIVIATRNKNKYNEILKILSNKPYKLLFAGDYPYLPEIEETGDTLYENALIKAKNTAILLNKPCLSDDTGLFVESLNGEPGINAAIYAGKSCSYEDNVNKLLNELDGSENRKAYFQTVCVLYNPIKDEIIHSIGTLFGNIIKKKRGLNGFGYDPIFIPDGYDITLAEMTDELKNMISHRYNAIRGLNVEC